MDHPVFNAIRRESLEPLGWFEAGPSELPGNAKFAILVGNAGPGMFARFARERDALGGRLDDWTRLVIERLAGDLDAAAVFPFDRPPLPFLSWARRGGGGHVSPLGLNVHGVYGLWHAYRAALLFPVVFDLPKPSAGQHPCETCLDRPCLSACPVEAFNGIAYDVDGCARHLDSGRGEACMSGGCLARRACPVGTAFTYHPAQASFHMRAFLAARRLADGKHTAGR